MEINFEALVGSTVAVITLAVIVQYVVQRLKILYEPLYKKATKQSEVPGTVDVAVAYVLAIGGTLLAGLDLLPAVGIELSVPYVGAVITGLLAGSGSRGIHDLLKAITEGANPS